MGCVISKKTAPVMPVVDHAEVSGSLCGSGGKLNPELWNRIEVDRSESGESGKISSNGADSQSFRLGNFQKQIEGDQVAAGWPSWLCAVAREAIQGWIPLKAESFKKLEKIGQGTYSSVFKARDLQTGNFVALKKVRFDNFEPRSVRFMAREILILRRLNHPNIMKLEGLITSRSSCNIYLVFEYMDHDLAGLSSSPDITFNESQVKGYMHQLLSGLEHCHSHGVLHRDIKCANLLINNDGVLKIGDFGLSKIFNPAHRQQLTSRVITLWYRPPELLLGATHYEPFVDLWSVGCVLGEVFLKKPIFQGRTEVEQIDKIFKLCGSPPDEYWKKSRLPHEKPFKPQQAYQSCLQDTFRFLPQSTYKLLETFLSIEPHKRGTAAAALSSEYFRTQPYACEPSSMPKYSPKKEIDIKCRELLRMKANGTTRPPVVARRHSRSKSSQRSSLSSKLSGTEESWLKVENMQRNVGKQNLARVNDEAGLFIDMQHKASIRVGNGDLRIRHTSRVVNHFSAPIQFDASSGFKWANKSREEQTAIRPLGKPSSKDSPPGMLYPSNLLRSKNSFHPHGHGKGDGLGFHPHSTFDKFCVAEKTLMVHQWVQLGHPVPYAFQSHDSIDMPCDFV
ncbi:putative serine/threonine-protein kinase [Platanthera guangdongensis]|uniref:[RNA-polymerase]-subunit kinase n=1 Tax=Platanthera guangdongensis TaxID=2320717 RepID=A0ABR2LXQ4_9ASPA